MLNECDATVLRELGIDDARTQMARLYGRFPFLFDIGGNRFRYHRGFRRFGTEFFVRSGDFELAQAVREAGAALERAGALRAALELYVRYDSPESVAALLAREGLTIAERQSGDVLDRAVRSLGEHRFSRSPVVLALKASAESRAGRFDTSESLFLHAIEAADGEVKSKIQYLYGCDLSRRNRSDCSAIFEALLDTGPASQAQEAMIRAALAQAYVMQDKLAPAGGQAEIALRQCEGIDDPKIRGLIHARAAFVTLYAGKDHARASQLAQHALELALSAREYVVAIGCCSVLNVIAQEREDVRAALFYLDQLSQCSVLSGNVEFQQYAVLAMLELEVERKRDERIERLLRSLRAFDLHYERLVTSDGFLPSRALQMAWSGEFERAYFLLAPSAAQQIGDDFLALRHAQVALYAAAAGRSSSAREEIEASRQHLASVEERSQKAARAHAFLALACDLLDLEIEARSHLQVGRDMSVNAPRLAALIEGAAAIHERMHGNAEAASVGTALDRMCSLDSWRFRRAFRPAAFSGACLQHRSVTMNATAIDVLTQRDAYALCEALADAREAVAAEMAVRLGSPSRWTVAADVYADDFLRRLITAENDADFEPFWGWLERIGDFPAAPGREVLVGVPSVVAALATRSATLGGECTVAAHLAAILDRVFTTVAPLSERTAEAVEELNEVDAFINLVMTQLDRHDSLSAEHSRAVANWCSRLARQLHFDAASTTLLTRAGLVHDVGKLRIPTEILEAPRALSDEEWAIMKSHVTQGEELARSKPFLLDLIPAIRHHHERINGSGYPDGLSGDRIPMVARVVAVADAFNAMIGRRPYRPPILPSVAIDELVSGAGSQFDPEIVQALIALMR